MMPSTCNLDQDSASSESSARSVIRRRRLEAMAKRRRSVVMQRRLIQRYLSHQREEGGAAVSCEMDEESDRADKRDIRLDITLSSATFSSGSPTTVTDTGSAAMETTDVDSSLAPPSHTHTHTTPVTRSKYFSARPITPQGPLPSPAALLPASRYASSPLLSTGDERVYWDDLRHRVITARAETIGRSEMQKRHSGVSGGSAHGGGHIVPLYDDFCPINAGDSVPLYGDFHPNHHAPPLLPLVRDAEGSEPGDIDNDSGRSDSTEAWSNCTGSNCGLSLRSAPIVLTSGKHYSGGAPGPFPPHAALQSSISTLPVARRNRTTATCADSVSTNQNAATDPGGTTASSERTPKTAIGSRARGRISSKELLDTPIAGNLSVTKPSRRMSNPLQSSSMRHIRPKTREEWDRYGASGNGARTGPNWDAMSAPSISKRVDKRESWRVHSDALTADETETNASLNSLQDPPIPPVPKPKKRFSIARLLPRRRKKKSKEKMASESKAQQRCPHPPHVEHLDPILGIPLDKVDPRHIFRKQSSLDRGHSAQRYRSGQCGDRGVGEVVFEGMPPPHRLQQGGLER